MKDRFSGFPEIQRVWGETEGVDGVTASYPGAVVGWVLWKAGTEMQLRRAKGLWRA